MNSIFRHFIFQFLLTASFGWVCSAAPLKLVSVDFGKIRNETTVTPQEKSKKLVDGAQKVFNPNFFYLLYPIFQEALALDPNNLTAEFYVKSLAPAMHLKGLFKRDSSIVQGLNKVYQKNILRAVRNADPTTVKFLTEATDEDIKTESDVQKWIHASVDDIFSARQFFIDRRNSEFTVNLTYKLPRENESTSNADIFQSFLNFNLSAHSDCRLEKADEVITKVGCNEYVTHEIKFNYASMDIMRMMSAIDLIYFMFPTLYQMDGAIDLYANNATRWHAEDIAAYFRSVPEFGLLNSPKYIQKFAKLKVDAELVVPFLEDTLSAGLGLANVKKCEQAISQCLVTFEPLLFVLYGFKAGAQTVSLKQKVTRIDSSSLLRTPITDLKTQIPTQFSPDHSIMHMGDSTLGGVFPDGDSDLLLQDNKR